MASTYRAVLRGDRLEWMGSKPSGRRESLEPVEVEVTIMENGPRHAGSPMAAALEELAALESRLSIEDPVRWQRELRGDRHLPGRDED